MKTINDSFRGADHRLSLIDLELPKNFNNEIIIFIHGFMGFKDWGAWNLVQAYFVNKGYGFCKFNTSHNGGSVEQGIDFPDPEAFGRNTYSKEIEDVKAVIKYIDTKNSNWNGHLIGHSKGGAIAIISGNQFEKIKSVSTWASIASIENRFPKGEVLNEWRDQGVRFVKNGRTKQDLPQNFNLYNDFQKNKSRFHIERICKKYVKPIAHFHGLEDTSVPSESSQKLADWSKGELHMIKETNHVFGSSHPWVATEMPDTLEKLCGLTLKFISKIKT